MISPHGNLYNSKKTFKFKFCANFSKFFFKKNVNQRKLKYMQTKLLKLKEKKC